MTVCWPGEEIRLVCGGCGGLGGAGARPWPSLLSWGQAMAANGLASGPTLLVSVRQALNNLYF